MTVSKTEMVPVPLPTEIPPPPSLDQIPLEILHSATVEMLIQQNDDLSSRLRVNIRRNSILEQKILEMEKSLKEANRQRENIEAQSEIIKEKEKIWLTQKEEKDRQRQSLAEEIELLELRYNELYTASRQQSREQHKEAMSFKEDIERLTRKIEIQHNIRMRAKDRLREFLMVAAQDMNLSDGQMKQSQSSNRILKRNFEHLRNEINQKEQFFRDQLESFKSASLKAMNAVKEKNEELKLKNESLAEAKEALQREIQEIGQALHEERKSRIKMTQISQELSELKNERIRFKRDLQEAIEKSEESRQREIARGKELDKKVESTQLQLQEQKKIVETCEGKMLELSRDNSELSIQLETIQKLWIEAQNKLEKEEMKRKSLEKINRELSLDFKENKIERATRQANSVIHKTTLVANEQEHPLQSILASQKIPTSKGSDLDI